MEKSKLQLEIKKSKPKYDEAKTVTNYVSDRVRDVVIDKSKEIKETKNVGGAKVIKMLSTNAAGLVKGKVKSLLEAIEYHNPNIICIQETHFRRKGRFKLNNFTVFEAIRDTKCGGIMIVIKNYLNPKLVNEYNEGFELIIVHITTCYGKIRLICGYGPQENWIEEKRIPFFLALEKEIEKAKLVGEEVIIQMDANAKLGEK